MPNSMRNSACCDDTVLGQTAASGRRTPLGCPVVPDVYVIGARRRDPPGSRRRLAALELGVRPESRNRTHREARVRGKLDFVARRARYAAQRADATNAFAPESLQDVRDLRAR